MVLLERKLKEFHIKVLQLTSKLNECSESLAWMQTFILSFNQMSEDLSINYGSRLLLKGVNLRRRTKICWKYIKQLINSLIK